MGNNLKDSGIAWIGEMPSDWELSKNKYNITICNGREVEVEEGDFPVYGTGGAFKNTNEYLYDGESVLLGRKGTIDKPLYVNGKFWTVDTAFYTIMNDSMYVKYFYYLACSFDYTYYQTGSTVPSMTQTDLDGIYIPKMPLNEQYAIANYLDEKCAKIDDILSDLNKQVELLMNYKKSLITEIVTKGLKSNVELKDSGMEWIGMIPNDWEISKLKYVSNFVNGDRGENYPSGNDMVDEGIIFITSNNIHNVELDNSPQISKYITSERYDLLGGAKLEIGDIIYCLRGSVGMCSINTNETEGTIASSLVDIKPQKVNSYFLNYVLQSYINSYQTNLFTNGSCAANLSAENVSNYYFAMPPHQEQQEIVNYLDKKCAKIDDLIEDKQTQIEKMEKYRKSLIYEYVTGKKRVKGF